MERLLWRQPASARIKFGTPTPGNVQAVALRSWLDFASSQYAKTITRTTSKSGLAAFYAQRNEWNMITSDQALDIALQTPEHLLALYGCYRANAVWFAQSTPAASYLQTKNGSCGPETNEQLWAHSRYWQMQSEAVWVTLLAAHAVVGLCTGTDGESATGVRSAALRQETSCICPTCTARLCGQMQNAPTLAQAERG